MAPLHLDLLPVLRAKMRVPVVFKRQQQADALTLAVSMVDGVRGTPSMQYDRTGVHILFEADDVDRTVLEQRVIAIVKRIQSTAP